MIQTCVVCEQPVREVFRKHEIGVLHCSACGHRCADLTPQPGHTAELYADDYFTAGADGYADYVADGEIVRRRGRWYARMLAGQGVPPGRVLDVGAAAGFFLSGLMDEGWSGCGLEPNAGMVRYASETLGLSMHQGVLESASVDEQFDLVSMVQVMAHLVDPLAALQHAAEHTRPGGYWLIETWNYSSLTARVFGRAWHQYSPPRTLHWFSPGSLRALAARFGMQEVAAGRPDKSISGKHARSLLRHAMGDSLLARIATAPSRLLPDRLRIPYPADDLNYRLFRNEGSGPLPI